LNLRWAGKDGHDAVRGYGVAASGWVGAHDGREDRKIQSGRARHHRESAVAAAAGRPLAGVPARAIGGRLSLMSG